MADTKRAEGETSAAAANPELKTEMKADVKEIRPTRMPNPMWKYMGFGENFRPKLPSRKWVICLSMIGGLTAAIVYDKREKKRAQRKWCKLVEHVSREPLDPRAMPRKLTIFLEGPPTDGLRVAQDHFQEYIKPILVASGLDWEFVQGRKEGDIRAEVADRIRSLRLPLNLRTDEDDIAQIRRKTGVKEYEGAHGDIIVGRNTWKEYVRGIHEGWLGPLTEPPKPILEAPSENQKSDDSVGTPETLAGTTLHADAQPPSKETAQVDEKAKKSSQPAPYISTSAYSSAPTPAEIPAEFDPCSPISFPHVLGFLNTPKRLYRFLNRRVLADNIGREVAAIILSTYRPYYTSSEISPAMFHLSADNDTSAQNSYLPQVAEQQTALLEEEKEWHKSARARVDGEAERTWLEPMVLDPRIADRMRRFELSAEDEERAKQIRIPEKEIEGWIKGSLRGAWRVGMSYFSGEEEKRGKCAAEGDEPLL